MTESNKEKVEYLLRYHESIQARANQVDEHGAGALNIAVVVAAVAIFGSDTLNKDIILILIPMSVIIVFSIHSFNNRITAILGGCLAGVEDVLAELIGKNIYINNRGLKPLYHAPFFITNDAMGIMFGVFGLAGTYYAFVEMFSKNMLPLIYLILYIVVFIVFSLIYFFELGTNEEIKDQARTYYHKAYTQFEVNDKDVDLKALDQDFSERYQKTYIINIFKTFFNRSCSRNKK